MSGSTNNKIKDNNKQVEKQYEYDKDVYDYTNYVNEKKYENSVKNTKLKQADLDNSVAYKDAVNKQEYEFNKALQAYQYSNDKKVYKQALKDYDQQKELNSMVGALAQSAEDKKLDEALIKKNFDLGDQDILLDTAKKDKQYGVKGLANQVKFAEEQLKLDTDSYDKKFTKQKAKKDLQKLDAQLTQLEKDKKYLWQNAKIEQGKIKNQFQKEKTSNFENRIESLIKRERAIGSERALGREGNSAAASVDSILAEYGREQSSLVDSLVFAKEDKKLATQSNWKSTKNQVQQKKLGIALNKLEQTSVKQKKKFDLKGIEIKNSKLETAFDELKTKAELDTKKLKSDFKLKKQTIKQSKQKINTSFDSAKEQYKLASQKIKLDEYGANLTALGKVPIKPKKPPALPAPIKLPKTKLPMPMKPIKGPKPIKGALGKTSVWNDVGDVLNVGLQVASIAVPFL